MDHPDIVFEASFEVANKVGGIYTVITSKLPYMNNIYDSYFLVGPLFDEVPADVDVQTPPASFAQVFSSLAAEGIRCVYGTWNVKGKPRVILVDAREFSPHLNGIKKALWDSFGVDSLDSGYDFNEPVLWSYGVGKLVAGLTKVFSQKKVLLHAHEWLSGASVLYSKLHQVPIKTVFTTHATMLGRSLASRDELYSQAFEHIDADNRAKELGIAPKHTMEKACAHASDEFTTVSQTTMEEAKAFYGREAKILPNGITTESFPTFEEATYNHLQYKNQLQHFVMAHFFPYYVFDLEKTLFFYSSGRYEFHNKGMDITIDALAKLNCELKKDPQSKSVVMFFFVPAGQNGVRSDIVENRNRLYDLLADLQAKSKQLIDELLLDAFEQKNASRVESMVSAIHHTVSFMKRQGTPPLSTHHLDTENDPIINACKRVGLTNAEDDKVKIVFIPSYLDGSDSILNMHYDEAVSACHLGIFPSNYEPWGYTPLESLALSVPSVTSIRSGFGQHMKDKIQGTNPGLFVLEDMDQHLKAAQELSAVLLRFTKLHHDERVATKMNAHMLAHHADWRQLIKHYIDVHNFKK
jgi:glycogen(starch) synthase